MILAQARGRPQTSPSLTLPSRAKVTVEEVLSYDCARNVAAIVRPGDQIGPVFANGILVFTSVEAQDSSRMLLVNAGSGIYSVHLERDGMTRLRFAIPVAGQIEPRVFYMTYLHGQSFRSRYFEYSEDRPPVGKDDLDYMFMTARRAENLQAHLNYAIHETAEATLSAITEGRIQREQLRMRHLDGCDHISRQSPSLARNLKYNLDMLDLIVAGPVHRAVGGRAPASQR